MPEGRVGLSLTTTPQLHPIPHSKTANILRPNFGLLNTCQPDKETELRHINEVQRLAVLHSVLRPTFLPLLVGDVERCRIWKM